LKYNPLLGEYFIVIHTDQGKYKSIFYSTNLIKIITEIPNNMLYNACGCAHFLITVSLNICRLVKKVGIKRKAVEIKHALL